MCEIVYQINNMFLEDREYFASNDEELFQYIEDKDFALGHHFSICHAEECVEQLRLWKNSKSYQMYVTPNV